MTIAEIVLATTSARIPSKRAHPPDQANSPIDKEVNGNASQAQSKPEAEERESPPRKRLRTRAAPVTRFKAFADAFNMDDIPSYDPVDEDIESQTLPSQGGDMTPKSVENESGAVNGDAGRGSKRARSPEEIDMMDGLLPAAAAMKRRKLEHPQKQDKSATSSNNSANERLSKNAKAKTQIDVRKAARERREAEEAAAKRDQEALEEINGDMTIDEMKKLAVIEVMELPTRETPSRSTDAESHGRWDERWNGRKNFKRFRRHGEPTTNVRRLGQNVIVPLVEVAQKSYGIGESYWSSSRNQEDDSSRRTGRRAEPTSQTQDHTQGEAPASTQTQTQSVTQESTSPTTTRLQQEAAAIVGAIDIDRPRKTRLADKTQRSQQTMNLTRGKQPSSSTARPAAKKQKTIRTKAASESDSDEGLRFKFGGRKR